jgi:hypothetical protein
LQPDDIVSNPFGSQSWNRYSYANDNPIRFNDPTGHKACGDGEDIECDGSTNTNTPANLNKSSNPNQPDKIDIDKLPSEKAKEKVLKLYTVYQTMWYEKSGWWWDRYGSGGFTISEFMAVIWGYEQAGYPNAEKFASALGNKASVWCHSMGCSPFTAEGSMYFLASYSQSARSRSSCLNAGTCTLDGVMYAPPKYWAHNSMSIVEGIEQNAFTGYPGPNDLFDVGNVSLRSDIFRRMLRLGMVNTVYGQIGEDRMIILTYCQSQMVNYAMANGGSKAINKRSYGSFCGG